MRRIPIELIIVLLLIGVAIGIAWSKGERMEAQITDHDARLAVLEKDHAGRKQAKARTAVVVGFAGRCLEKLTFGLIKMH